LLSRPIQPTATGLWAKVEPSGKPDAWFRIFKCGVIRAMADGTLDSQVGARIGNGLGIMRACLETQKLEPLEARMDEIADRVARNRTNAAREKTHP